MRYLSFCECYHSLHIELSVRKVDVSVSKPLFMHKVVDYTFPTLASMQVFDAMKSKDWQEVKSLLTRKTLGSADFEMFHSDVSSSLILSSSTFPAHKYDGNAAQSEVS